jgi:hypothetical protein
MGKDKKLKIIFKCILKVILYIAFVLIASFIIILLLTNALINLKVINKDTAAIITLCFTFISTIIISIIHYTKKAKEKNIIFKIPNFVKYYILSVILIDLLVSIKPSVEINIEEAQNILSIEFALFAILTALVVTWCVIAEKEINQNKLKTKPFGLDERVSKFLDDYKKNIAAKNYFWDIIPFGVSLLFMSYVAINILINKKIDMITQTLLYYNLRLLLDSMIILIVDILTPTITRLFIQKKDLVNDKQYDNEIFAGMVEDKIENSINEICIKNPKFNNLSTQAQEEIKTKMLKGCEPEMNKIIQERTDNTTKNED